MSGTDYSAYNDPHSWFTSEELFNEAKAIADKVPGGKVIWNPAGFYSVWNPNSGSWVGGLLKNIVVKTLDAAIKTATGQIAGNIGLAFGGEGGPIDVPGIPSVGEISAGGSGRTDADRASQVVDEPVDYPVNYPAGWESGNPYDAWIGDQILQNLNPDIGLVTPEFQPPGGGGGGDTETTIDETPGGGSETATDIQDDVETVDTTDTEGEVTIVDDTDVGDIFFPRGPHTKVVYVEAGDPRIGTTSGQMPDGQGGIEAEYVYEERPDDDIDIIIPGTDDEGGGTDDEDISIDETTTIDTEVDVDEIDTTDETDIGEGEGEGEGEGIGTDIDTGGEDGGTGGGEGTGTGTGTGEGTGEGEGEGEDGINNNIGLGLGLLALSQFNESVSVKRGKPIEPLARKEQGFLTSPHSRQVEEFASQSAPTAKPQIKRSQPGALDPMTLTSAIVGKLNDGGFLKRGRMNFS